MAEKVKMTRVITIPYGIWYVKGLKWITDGRFDGHEPGEGDPMMDEFVESVADGVLFDCLLANGRFFFTCSKIKRAGGKLAHAESFGYVNGAFFTGDDLRIDPGFDGILFGLSDD